VKKSVIRTGHRYGLPVIPGVGSASEALRALESGADALKVFPASALGTSFVRELRGPLPHAPLIPTGGIALEDVGAWLAAGAVACGVGGSLARGGPQQTAARVSAFLAAADERAAARAVVD
jgi:2-dehydro-3-deoxyphosphogluconate aldolase/(4S)-4-hydroxy-2-oxoglutarate aldolase